MDMNPVRDGKKPLTDASLSILDACLRTVKQNQLKDGQNMISLKPYITSDKPVKAIEADQSSCDSYGISA